jgi:hypothetical protein
VVLRDLPCDPATDVHSRHQVVDIDDPRLELDHQQDSGRGVPRDDIDDAALTASSE